MNNWNGKPYHSLDYMLRERFGEKVYKVTLNGGMSCPNRDGTIGHGGSESAAVFSAVKGAAEISPQAQPFPSPGRLTAKLKCCPPSVQSTNILPISRHIPIPMLRFLIWSGFSRKPFPIQGLWRFPSAPVQTAWERM